MRPESPNKQQLRQSHLAKWFDTLTPKIGLAIFVAEECARPASLWKRLGKAPLFLRLSS